MHTRSKVVELSGYKFRIHKLPPEVGSFILMRLLGVSMRMAASSEPVKKDEQPKQQEVEISGEMKVRAITFSVFSGGLSFEDFKFIQEHCMKVVSVVKVREDVEFPLPVMLADGSYTPDGSFIADSITLITKLTTEVLVLCFADFFEESSPGSQG